MIKRTLSREQEGGLAEIRRIIERVGVTPEQLMRAYEASGPRKLSDEQLSGAAQVNALMVQFSVSQEELKSIFESASRVAANAVGEELVSEIAAVPASGDTPVSQHAAHAEATQPSALVIAECSSSAEPSAQGAGEAQREGEGVSAVASGSVARPMRPGDPGYVRYRHPTKRGLRWDGRGEQPPWLRQALLEDGLSLKQLIPPENFPLDEPFAGLPAGVPYESLELRA